MNRKTNWSDGSFLSDKSSQNPSFDTRCFRCGSASTSPRLWVTLHSHTILINELIFNNVLFKDLKAKGCFLIVTIRRSNDFSTEVQARNKGFLLSLAACVVLVIGMGYGRFAFTGVLPVMLHEQILSLTTGNLAASANYAGYLIGALLLSKARPSDARHLCFGSVLATLAGIALLAWLRSPTAIIVVRGIAGLCSAVSLISASLWLLQHMKHAHGAPMMYAGVGLGIFISAEFISLGKALTLSSQTIWIMCAISAAAFFLIISRLLNSPPDLLTDYRRPAQSGATGGSLRVLPHTGC